MAQYRKAILTNEGINLLNEILEGDGELEFCELAAGSGTYGTQEKGISFIREMTRLKETRQRQSFSYIRDTGNGCVHLKAYLTNEDLQEGYQITEIGIFARKKDGAGMVLYCVILADEPDFFPQFTGKPYKIVFDFLVKISDAENVSILFTPDTYALAEDLAGVESRLQGELGVLYEELFNSATDSDIDRIILGTYEDEEDEDGVFDVITEEEIDAIINGTYVEGGDDGETADFADIDKIIAKLF